MYRFVVEGFIKGYERRGLFPIPDVLSHIGENTPVFEGDIVPVVSLRYMVFKRSLVCVSCGLEGQYFAKERSARAIWGKKELSGKFLGYRPATQSWHFNLYGIDFNGNEVMLTKDHIIPRSKGGKEDLDNLQTMCAICNCKKADNPDWQYRINWPGGFDIGK
jgi:5-methylcytosine-specific restriction endonuclease McrA